MHLSEQFVVYVHISSQDPYFRFNDLSYRWIAYDNWTYTTIFNASAELRWNSLPCLLLYYFEFLHNSLFCSKRAKEKVLLVFDGVDTVSSIWLNGVKVGSTDNMFRRYVSSPGGKQLFLSFFFLFSFCFIYILCCLCAGFLSWRLAEGWGKWAGSSIPVSGSLCISEV